MSKLSALKGISSHLDPATEIKFKDGDRPRFFLHAETTDRLLLFASNGRMFTLACASLPGGRLLVASEAGDGFILPEDEAAAQTRAGRQILNLKEGVRARVCRPVQGDHLAVIGNNHKLRVFPRAELPEMGRGKGVRLQRYKDKDGRLDDAVTFDLADGISWKDTAGRTRTVAEADLAEWVGARAALGEWRRGGLPGRTASAEASEAIGRGRFDKQGIVP